MCGLVGSNFPETSSTAAIEISQMLQKLNQRGYDNAGIAAIVQKENTYKLICFKVAGNAHKLESELQKSHDFDRVVTIIGHIRWATTGKVVLENSHPHLDYTCKIGVIHNGKIDNVQYLKSILLKESEATKKLAKQNPSHPIFDVRFDSKSDTPVIPNLIAMHMYRHRENSNKKECFIKAVQKTASEIAGANAFMVIHEDFPGLILGSKLGSPLQLTKPDQGYDLVSDLSAYAEKKDSILSKYVEDGQIIELNENGFKEHDFESISLENNTLENDFTTVDLSELIAQKNGHPHYMISEIYQQVESVIRVLSDRLVPATNEIFLGGPKKYEERLKTINKIYLVGSGSSFYVAKLIELAIAKYTDIFCKAIESEEFEESYPRIDGNTLGIGFTQSGESGGTLAAIKHINSCGGLSMGIVNDVGTSVPHYTKFGVFVRACKEASIVATKTFTGSYVAALMFVIKLSRIRGNTTPEKTEELVNELAKLPELIKHTLNCEGRIKELVHKYSNSEVTNILDKINESNQEKQLALLAKQLVKAKENEIVTRYILGSGFNLPIAYEIKVKTEEVTGNRSGNFVAFPSRNAKHGPLAKASKNTLVIHLVSDDKNFTHTKGAMVEYHSRNARNICITNISVARELEGYYEDMIIIPKSLEEINPILNLIVLQLYSYHLSLVSGVNTDQIRNLAKSVTTI